MADLPLREPETPPTSTALRIEGTRLRISVPVVDANGVVILGRDLNGGFQLNDLDVPQVIRDDATALVTAVLRWKRVL